MSDTGIMELPAEAPAPRSWAEPNAKGQWPEDALDRVHAPGNLGALLLIQQADGWRAGWEAMLPEATEVDPPTIRQAAMSREQTTVLALERLISWCGEQKTRGKRKHKEAAAQLQEWALGLENRAKFAEQIAGGDLRADAGNAAPEQIQDVQVGPPVLHASANGSDLSSGIQILKLEDIHESPLNPRQIYPEAAMEELIESMKRSGFRSYQPLICRPRAEGGFEIAAGHRRRRAAEAAGLRTVAVFVREMTDAELLDILNFENSGREDVHPLHEAAGWRTWMEKTGHGVKDIAARIGQSIEYVYQRLKYAALIPEAAKAFLEQKITGGHAILIARLQAKEQEKALKRIFWRADGIPISTRDLAEWLHGEAYQDLRGCPFDRTDKSLLAGAGACDDCPKRAANIPGFEFDKEDPEADLCTDKKCYGQKLDNHLFRIRTDLLPSAGNMGLMVSENWNTKKKGAHVKGTWEKVNAKEKGAQPAVVVEGPNVGKVIHVKLKPAPKAQHTAARVDYEAGRKEREAKAARESAIRCKILEAVLAKVEWPLSRTDMEAVAGALIGSEGVEMCEARGIKGTRYETAPGKLLETVKSETDLARLVMEAVLFSDAHPGAYSLDRDKGATLLETAKRYKVDASKIRREMEEAAKAAEGGTRREVAKPGPAAKKAAPAKKAAAKKPATKKKILAPAARKRIAAVRKRWATFKDAQRKALGKEKQ